MIVSIDKKFPLGPGEKIDLGNGFFALVDPADFNRINRHKWYAKKSFNCWYACRRIVENGQARIIRMHRIIAETPAGMVCHHINHKTFDNRLANLLNMLEFDHVKMHSWR